jgi:hypothetical protein
MSTSLSQRTRDLMQRALDALGGDATDLITTLVASAFVDGRDAALGKQLVPRTSEEKEFAQPAIRGGAPYP